MLLGVCKATASEVMSTYEHISEEEQWEKLNIDKKREIILHRENCNRKIEELH
jgi:hypothetical protein